MNKDPRNPDRGSLSSAKRELLRRRLRGKSKSVSARGDIIPGSDRESAPLSSAQQRLWFLDRYETEQPVYNLPAAYRIRGALRPDILRRCLNHIALRHQVLRTVFRQVDGEPRQVIMEDMVIEMPVVDLSGFHPEERERKSMELAEQVAQRRFDLSRGPLIRASLFKLDRREYMLVFCLHHIISDGWSNHILIGELTELYEAFSEGREPELPELPVQYADFAAWQRERLNHEQLRKQLHYWEEKLKGAPPVLHLPTDTTRPPVQSFRGEYLEFDLEGYTAEALRQLSREENATLFMTLLSGFAVLLSRYSGQKDLVIGTPIANRNLYQVEKLIGFFVNTLAIRADLTGDPAFRQLVGRIRETALDAFSHQDIPFERIVEELRPERDLSRTPVFQVMYGHQNMPFLQMELTGLKIESIKMLSSTAKFDLIITTYSDPRGIHGYVNYNSDLFSGTTVKRMISHLKNILVNAADNPDLNISRIPMMTGEEKSRIVYKWNDTGESDYTGKLMHLMFEQQVRERPGEMAVVYPGGELTYRQLNSRVNHLAHYLIRKGVKPETRVGICMERSHQALTGLLAILKCGGVYIPLDPSYPSRRLSFMMADSGLNIILTGDETGEIDGVEGKMVINIDKEWKNIGKEDDSNPDVNISPGNLAYIIYTSGSTGQPKGVMLTHRGLANLVCWHRDEYRVKPDDRVTHMGNLSFDLSIWEVCPCLAAGACIFIPPGEVRLSPTRLVEWLESRDIALCTLPTPMAEEVMEEEWPGDIHLRAVFTGGDRLTKRPGEDLPFRLFNHYGPTEITVLATSGEVTSRQGEGYSPPSIGRAVSNTGVYILDENMQPVPPGVPGEICISGAGLARGYWNRPAVTASSFVPHPLNGGGGERLYRSGDRGRFLEDGSIEFMGRLDDQIKIRGYRIEPSGIEVVLNDHPGIRDAAVLLKDSRKTGDKILSCYVVPEEGSEPGADEIRSYLGERLPRYMIPSVFIIMINLPLTENGKLDRDSLPHPDSVELERSSEYVAPRDELERKIVSLWEELLQVDKIGVDDNFFDIGGHSLLLVKVNQRLEDMFNRKIPVVDMFKYPTVAALTRYLSGEGGGEPGFQSSRKRGEARRKSLRRRSLRRKSSRGSRREDKHG